MTVSSAIISGKLDFMHVTLVNQRTGELKNIKVGFSWTLFLFSGLFGLPLFLRRLYVWGAVFLALWLLYIFGPRLLAAQSTELGMATAIDLWLLVNIIFLGLSIWVGIKGNEMTAKNLLENGWRFAEPNSQMTRFAIAKWGLSDQWISKNRELQVAPPISETNAEKIPSVLTEPISPVSVHPKPPHDFTYPSVPVGSPAGSPDSASKSKSSNRPFWILATAVTALFALFVGIFIGTHSKSPSPNEIPAPVRRAEIVAPEAPSASPAVQVHQEDSSASTLDLKSPVPNETPRPSVKSATPLSVAGGATESQSQLPEQAAPRAMPANTPPVGTPTSSLANARPMFSSQSANEYIQSYDAYIDDFKQAYKAMKQGDMAKYQAVLQRAHELQSRGEKLGGELSPEEQVRFADYLSKKADELAQFAPELKKEPAVAQTLPGEQPALTSDQATTAMNFLQDLRGTPHVKSVDYDSKTDSYLWKGPTTGKQMSMSRTDFNNQIWTPYQATAAMNFLQDKRGTPHVKSVGYDSKTDSYLWKGPTTGKRMSMSRADFDDQVLAPYLNRQQYQFTREKGWSPLPSAQAQP